MNKMQKKRKNKVYFKSRGSVTRFFNLIVYNIVRTPLRFLSMLVFGSRLHNYNRLIRNKSYILICNHQSYLDPVMFPTMCQGTFSFAARHTLFRNPIFAKLITFLGAFPIIRGSTNNEVFKLMVDETQHGSSLIIFPEGTRSLDGKIKKFKGGVEIILRKTKAPVQIAIVSGNHKILPKNGKMNNLSAFPMNTIFAKPIESEEYLSYEARTIGDFLELKTRELFDELHSKPYLKMRGITAFSQIITQIFNIYTTGVIKLVRIFKSKNKKRRR